MKKYFKILFALCCFAAFALAHSEGPQVQNTVKAALQKRSAKIHTITKEVDNMLTGKGMIRTTMMGHGNGMMGTNMNVNGMAGANMNGHGIMNGMMNGGMHNPVMEGMMAVMRMMGNTDSHGMMGMFTPDLKNPGRYHISGENIWETVMDDMMYDMERTRESYNDPDVDFCTMMIPHHWGAIFMCEEERKIGRSKVILDICDEIIWSQMLDIAKFSKFLVEKGIKYEDPSMMPSVDYVVEWDGKTYDPTHYMAQGEVPYWVTVGALIGQGITSKAQWKAMSADTKAHNK